MAWRVMNMITKNTGGFPSFLPLRAEWAVFFVAAAILLSLPLPALGQSNAPDPFMMLHFDKNRSDSAGGTFHSIGDGGRISISQERFKSGGGSAYSNGSIYGDLTVPFYGGNKTSANPKGNIFDFETSDFTVDFWVYPLAEPSETQRVDSTGTLVDAHYANFFYAFGRPSQNEEFHSDGTPINYQNPILQFFMSGERMYFQQDDNSTKARNFQIWIDRRCAAASGEGACDSARDFELNKWNHVAIQRKEGKFNIALNGRLGKWSFDSNGNASAAVPLHAPADLVLSSPFWMIGPNNVHVPFTGYMDEFRITKGKALWPLGDNELFTPPASYPFPEKDLTVLTPKANEEVTVTKEGSFIISWRSTNWLPGDTVDVSIICRPPDTLPDTLPLKKNLANTGALAVRFTPDLFAFENVFVKKVAAPADSPVSYPCEAKVESSTKNSGGNLIAFSPPFTVTPARPSVLLPRRDNFALWLPFDFSADDWSPSKLSVAVFKDINRPDFLHADADENKEFGGGVLALNGKTDSSKQAIMAALPRKENPVTLGSGEFTIDFWVRPDGAMDKNTLIFAVPFFSNSDSTVVTGQLQFYGRLDGGPSLYITSPSGTKVQSGGDSLFPDRWNHVAIERKNATVSGEKDRIGVAVNGWRWGWTELDTSFVLEPFPYIIFGWPWPANAVQSGNNPFRGKIDEFRIIKGETLWGNVPLNTQFLLPTEPTPYLIPSGESPHVIDASREDSSLLLHFDETAAPYRDGSRNNASVGQFQGIALPGNVQGTAARFGSGAIDFNGKKAANERQALSVLPAGDALLFGDDDFTIDFWVYPRNIGPRDTSPFSSTIPLFQMYESEANYFKEGSEVFTVSYSTGKGLVSVDYPYPYQKPVPGVVKYWMEQKLNLWEIADSLKNRQWNHIALQRKRIGEQGKQDEFSMFVNGKTSYRYTVPHITFGNFGRLVFGWPFPETYGVDELFPYNAFDGIIDEFRVVKGKALFGEVEEFGSFVLPSAPAQGVATVRSPSDVLQTLSVETIPAQPRATLAASDADAPKSRALAGAPAARAVAREMLIKKVNGDRNYTMSFDANEEPIRVVYWAANSGDGKLREYEYDGEGNRSREVYYNGAGEVTDIVSYYPNADGGGMRQDARWRREKDAQGNSVTIETLSEFDSQGRIVYSHEYRGGAFRFAKTFQYYADTVNGKLAYDIFYAGPNNWEKTVHEYNGTGEKLKRITRTQMLPAPVGAPAVFQTVSEFNAAGVLVSAWRISAASLAGAASKIEDVKYRADGQILSVDIFDFEHKIKTNIPYKEISAGRTAPEYEYAAAMGVPVQGGISLAEDAAVSYAEYDYGSGAFQGSKRIEFADGSIDRFKSITEYSASGAKVKEIEFAYQAPASGGGGGRNLYSSQTVRTFDPGGKEAKREVFSYREGAETPYELRSYNGAGLLTMAAEIANKRFLNKKYYSGGESADDQWFEEEYSYGGGGLAVAQYYSFRGQRVLLRTSRYKASEINGAPQYVLDSSSEPNALAKKEVGDKIVESLNLKQTAELPKIAEAVRAILSQYQAALTSATTPAQKEQLYLKFSRRAVFAVYSIEFAEWGNKGITDDRALAQTATEWVGIDRDTGIPFQGVYLMPGNNPAQVAYIDFDDYEFSLSRAGSYSDLQTIPKKREKWDAEHRLANEATYRLDGSGRLAIYNEGSNEGSGGYLSVSELTKRDPSVMLLVDRLFADLKAQGVTLSGKDAAAEQETIQKVYEYFFNKSLFTYIWDLGDAIQTVGETFARGGGDCEDFAAVFLSILREAFHRLGNDDIQKRLGLAIGAVSEPAPISSTNRGVGHGGVFYSAPSGGASYYIEPSYLFSGGADQTLQREGILSPLSPSLALGGRLIGKTATVKEHGWNFAWDFSSMMSGAFTEYVQNSGFLQREPRVLAGVNPSERAASIPSYIEPYDEGVNDLANYFLRYIPDMNGRAPEFAVEYLHSEFSRLARYVPDGAQDEWKRVSETLAGVVGTKVNPILWTEGTLTGRTIDGDCEDLAFAEASVLQNILTKYYMRFGFTAYNAAAKAQSQVFVLAERNYKGDPSRDPHLYVAFVSEPRGTSGGEIMILDPQDGSVIPSQPFESVLNDKYLFYANSSKISAVSFYDWSTLRLSASVRTTVQQAIDAVNGVRPASAFQFSKSAQEYLDALGNRARVETFQPDPNFDYSSAVGNEPTEDGVPNDMQAAVRDELIAEGQAIATGGAFPPREDPSFPQQAAGVIVKFLKTLTRAATGGLVGKLIPGYDAPPKPPAGRTYSGEPSALPEIIPDPDFDYYSAVGNQQIVDPAKVIANLEYYSAIGNTVTVGPRQPAASGAESPRLTTIPSLVSFGHSATNYGIFFKPLLNRYEIVQYLGEPSPLQCRSKYVCADVQLSNQNYTERGKPENSRWGTPGVCSTTKFSCEQRVYYLGWVCETGYQQKDPKSGFFLNFDNDPRDDQCVLITDNPPGNSPPAQPQICGPEKALTGAEYEYGFKTTDSDYALSANAREAADSDKSRLERNEPFLKGGVPNPSYDKTKPTLPRPFDDETDGKLRYEIAYDGTGVFNAYLPDLASKDLFTESGTELKKTDISWPTPGSKSVKARAIDAWRATSAESALSVTVGKSDIAPSAVAGACDSGGKITVSWPAKQWSEEDWPNGTNINNFEPDKFSLYKKLAGEPDSAFAPVAEGLAGTVRGYDVFGLEAEKEYEFAIDSVVSNKCGGDFALSRRTVSAAAPALCPLPDLTASIVSVSAAPQFTSFRQSSNDDPNHYYFYTKAVVNVLGDIKNIGSGSVAGKEYDAALYKFSKNGTAVNPPTMVADSQRSYSGSGDVFSFTLPPASEVGSTTYRLCVDKDNNGVLGADDFAGTVAETDETNNCSGEAIISVEPRRKPAVDFKIDASGADACSGVSITLPWNAQAKLCWDVKDGEASVVP